VTTSEDRRGDCVSRHPRRTPSLLLLPLLLPGGELARRDVSEDAGVTAAVRSAWTRVAAVRIWSSLVAEMAPSDCAVSRSAVTLINAVRAPTVSGAAAASVAEVGSQLGLGLGGDPDGGDDRGCPPQQSTTAYG
jgi:hypothetical protein